MHRVHISFPAILGVLVLVLTLGIVPVSATFQIQQYTLTPSATPLQPGASQQVDATLQIIPQGFSTFIEGNSLQLTTDLKEGQWNIKVLQNGVPAAVIPAQGNTAFINGYLLSYPTSSDVAVSVSVSGVVPSGSNTVMLLQVVQLNNAGEPVAGQTQTISATVAVPGTAVTLATPAGTQISGPATAVPSPTKAPGPELYVVGFALFCGILLLGITRK